MIKISKAQQSVMIVSKSGEFRETPMLDNPEPSLLVEEGATTIPKGSTLKWVEAPDTLIKVMI